MSSKSISMEQIVALRKQTGMGILDVKNALVESNGDYEKASDILKIKGANIVSKKIDRETREGMVCISSNNESYAIVKVLCETDFVSNNSDFISLTQEIAQISLSTKESDIEKLLNSGNQKGELISEMINKSISSIREKIELSSAIYHKNNDNELFNFYIHNKSSNTTGKIVSCCVLKIENKSSLSNDKIDLLSSLAKDISMSIASMSPKYISFEHIPTEVIKKENEISEAIVKEDPKSASKPKNIIENMIQGKVSKTLRAYCLMDQCFVKDQNKTIKDVIDQTSKSLGTQVSISKFDSVTIG